MRAVYLPSLFESERLELEADKAHHFKNVIKLRDGEEILVLDGQGHSVMAKLSFEGKKKVLISTVNEIQKHEKSNELNIMIGQPKKEALDLALRNCGELGVAHIFITQTEYAQNYKINRERAEKILISALEQSNNKFLPRLHVNKINEVDLSRFHNIFILSTEKNSTNSVPKLSDKDLLVIGPEGGLSDDDYQFLQKEKQSYCINLPSGILRTPNAISCAAGYLWGSSMQS